jgi:L-threonylcarbamoyladenylate synthase
MSTSTRATARKRSAGTQRIRLRSNRLPKDVLARVIESLKADEVAIFPTETVYGIGASAFSISGIRRIYRLKGRRWNKPLALLVSSLDAAAPLVETIPPEAHRLARAFWPGPMTLVLTASPLGRLVTGGLETIGVRVPDHPVALAILKAFGMPLATTSVNRSGEDPATSGRTADKLFGAKVGWMIDGGVCPIKEASSVVDLSHYPFTIKRHGAIGKHVLEETLLRHSPR